MLDLQEEYNALITALFYFKGTGNFNVNLAGVKLNIIVHLPYELLVNTAGPPSLSTAIFCT